MDIRYLGHTAFELKHKSLSLIIDPFGTDVGLGTPQWKSDIVTICNKDYTENVLPLLVNKPKVINQPGEYEIRDLFIYGIRTAMKETPDGKKRENIIYKFEYENIHICHLSHLGEKLTDAQMENIGIVDILLLALGSDKTLNIKESKELIEELDPRVIIPVDTSHKGENLADSQTIQEFLKVMGKTTVEPIEFFSADKYTYTPEKTDIIFLKKTSVK
jgi:L-ascorbate metabolism protein UlaG (beta-lactamase superfamily)